MSTTPRLRSAFPTSPQNTIPRGGSSLGTRPGATPTPPIQKSDRARDQSGPLIPGNVIDVPTQRLYVLAIYAAVHAYRIYDYWTLLSDDLDSTWKFLKWLFIDGAMFFCLPAFKIPWLEWAFSTTLAIYFLHAVLNVFLMFQIPIPILTWLAAIGRYFYDRELSVSERRVKPADILHNSSLILGKQIIQILPEGSAVLNPDRLPFCLDESTTSVDLPIRINQTNPILIELIRFDLETNEPERIKIESKQARQLRKKADKAVHRNDRALHRDIRYTVKKPGLYRLSKVTDETNLDVQRRAIDTTVVSCPKAEIKNSQPHKCRGELSDLVLEVQGTPPLKIKYCRSINEVDRSSSLQSIQPDNFASPLVRTVGSGPLLDLEREDFSWARARTIPVPLNESLGSGGTWSYTIEEVHDVFGNVANYSQERELTESVKLPPGPQHQDFSVHDRPRISFQSCDSRNPLLVARGRGLEIPLSLTSTGKPLDADMPLTVTYSFRPANAELGSATDDEPRTERFALKDGADRPRIQEPGWYDLKSVSSGFCDGDVLEPASCLLQNPQQPDLSVKTEEMFDKCAGSSVGLRLDLDLIGTPPFTVRYHVRHGGQVRPMVMKVHTLRQQLELVPDQAGQYSYEFSDVSDKFYHAVSLSQKNIRYEIDVKPPASARFLPDRGERRSPCIEESLSFPIELSGQGPWKIQYELVHRGKREKKTVDVEANAYTIVTDKLRQGGEYSLALTSVTDGSGCRRSLNEEVKFAVRHDRPSASFGLIDGKRSISSLDHRKVRLPLRLKGESPWRLRYRNGGGSSPLLETTVKDGNGFLEVRENGLYEIEQVLDKSCPGSVDGAGRTFVVDWISRPSIQVADSPGDEIARPDVCEGDEDFVDFKIHGAPPYNIKYEQKLSPQSGPPAVSTKEFTAGVGSCSIRMDTSKTGRYQYKVLELADSLYDHDSRRFSPLVVRQTVNPRPSAQFAYPGKTYGYCKEEAEGDEVIPVKLTGQPPFSLEISIKHHTRGNSEIVTIPNISSNDYSYRVARQYLDLGPHTVTIHKVQDGRGCQQRNDRQASSVRVHVSDVPTIVSVEGKTDFCVGERISYALSGLPPFEVFYTFEGHKRKATSASTSFRRIAEKPGEFVITAVGDSASGRCKASQDIRKVIHGMPSVRISKGQESTVDIHEGGEADIQFDFWGTPPFHFTYTRSTIAKHGKKPKLLETKRETSHEHAKVIKASEAGVYEVVSIQDKYCSFSTQKDQGDRGQKLLQY